MTGNSLLIKYEEGWTEVHTADANDPLKRIESMIEMPGVLKEATAKKIGLELLALGTEPRESIAYIGLPLGEGGPTDYTFAEGDYINVDGRKRIAAVSVDEDDEGKVQVVPELKSPLDLQQAKINRTLARYASGADNGNHLTGPTKGLKGYGKDTRIYQLPAFTTDGPLKAIEGFESTPYVIGRPIVVTYLLGSLADAGVTPTIVRMLFEGSIIGSLLFPPGHKVEWVALQRVLVSKTDRLQFVVEAAGAGASGLTLQPGAVLA